MAIWSPWPLANLFWTRLTSSLFSILTMNGLPVTPTAASVKQLSRHLNRTPNSNSLPDLRSVGNVDRYDPNLVRLSLWSAPISVSSCLELSMFSFSGGSRPNCKNSWTLPTPIDFTTRYRFSSLLVAQAGLNTTSSSSSLFAFCLGRPGFHELAGVGPGIEVDALDSAGVDDHDCVRDGDGGLCDVGGGDHFTLARRRVSKDAFLVLGAEGRVQRQGPERSFDFGQTLVDFHHSRKKDQDGSLVALSGEVLVDFLHQSSNEVVIDISELEIFRVGFWLDLLAVAHGHCELQRVQNVIEVEVLDGERSSLDVDVRHA
ncbi:hypothetical protein OGAPHI_005599 [Ogataea philodendri]|uniref:Uncharacterized protein n=1 Tax=Ogataea philodendri TaxID=1378263 RepID=A0A9P8NZG2_9ASCO|nr:uncharacterized protein OGAPHI_005599 [Ogataea philodendri]KAH3662347.1 hypothetical protein OGAPHI_005599 [Ogataea philodendri]